jgi:hypothetical protein
MRIALVFRLFLVGLVTLVSGNALASKRVALVIGNSDYLHVSKLPNPAGDAAAIARLLSDAGFERVIRRADLGVREFRHAIREFAEISRGADMAVVFYAGHGMEVGGANYLIPVDAKLKTDLDIDDEVMPLDRVLRSLEAARTRFVILDACRDNPFLATMSRLSATRSIGRGLARIEPGASDMLIAFAAKAGSIAADGVTGNSPFTTALVKHVAEPGLDIRLALGKVRDDVLSITNGRQEPFVYGSLGGSTVSIAPAKPEPVAKPAAPAPVDMMAAMQRDYEFAERIGTTEVWELFLTRYPNGFYADLARAHVAKLAVAAAPPRPDPAPATPPVVMAAKPGAQNAETTISIKPAPVAQAEPDLVVISPNPAPVSSVPSDAIIANPAPVTLGTRPSEQKQAALTVPSVEADTPADGKRKSTVTEAIRNLQLELKRVGCDPGGDLGLWGDSTRRALEKFNQNAGTQLLVTVASIEALETVKARTDRVCPLTCRAGYRADGDRCVRGRKR